MGAGNGGSGLAWGPAPPVSVPGVSRPRRTVTAMRQEPLLPPEPASRAWAAGQAADVRARVAASYVGGPDTPHGPQMDLWELRAKAPALTLSFSATGSPQSPTFRAWSLTLLLSLPVAPPNLLLYGSSR